MRLLCLLWRLNINCYVATLNNMEVITSLFLRSKTKTFLMNETNEMNNNNSSACKHIKYLKITLQKSVLLGIIFDNAMGYKLERSVQ